MGFPAAKPGERAGVRMNRKKATRRKENRFSISDPARIFDFEPVSFWR